LAYLRHILNVDISDLLPFNFHKAAAAWSAAKLNPRKATLIFSLLRNPTSWEGFFS